MNLPKVKFFIDMPTSCPLKSNYIIPTTTVPKVTSGTSGHCSKLTGVLWQDYKFWGKSACQTPCKLLAWGRSVSVLDCALCHVFTKLGSHQLLWLKPSMVGKSMWKRKSGSEVQESVPCSMAHTSHECGYWNIQLKYIFILSISICSTFYWIVWVWICVKSFGPNCIRKELLATSFGIGSLRNNYWNNKDSGN